MSPTVNLSDSDSTTSLDGHSLSPPEQSVVDEIYHQQQQLVPAALGWTTTVGGTHRAKSTAGAVSGGGGKRAWENGPGEQPGRDRPAGMPGGHLHDGPGWLIAV